MYMKMKINMWLLLGALLSGAFFTACDDDDDPNLEAPITITGVYLQDPASAVPSRNVEFVRLGQVIRITGSGFTGLRQVFVNGHKTYFNPVYVSDQNVLMQLSGDTPTTEATEEVRNTIRLVKSGGIEKTLDIEIREAAPRISSISHTMPQAGEVITVYGSGLKEIERVVFPGNIEVTGGDIVSDEDGEFFTVVVPSGLTESGALFAFGANGGAYSPAYFNFKEGVILDFDGLGQQGFWGWSETGSMINDEDLESAVVGEGTRSQGNYVAHRPARVAEFNVANRRSEVWTAGNDVDDWRGQLTPHIPATTPVNQVAFQFDVYVPQPWSGTGFLKLLLMNNYNGGEWAGYTYNYVPWIDNKEVVPFETEGWVTVTVPFSDFYGFSEPEEGEEFTFEDVLAAREGATYKNFGIYFENSDFNLGQLTGNDADAETEFAGSAFTLNVYTDNWRVVPLEQPEYSDFPDEEEAE
jgi:hypothetical protein